MSVRLSLAELLRLFFQPVQFHLEPTDLCIQPGVVLLLGLLLFGDGGTENLG